MRSLVRMTVGLVVLGAGSLLADDLTWGGTYVADWNGFGTSPYTAIDTSTQTNQTISIYCLDYNDEIAPPFYWTASILSLTAPNVTGTGQYAGVYAAQYGGDYNSLVSAAYNQSHPSGETLSQVEVQGPPFVFGGDTSPGAGNYAVTINSQDAYTRYLEAAWLFQDIQSAIPNDVSTDMIAQVAAWELFVNSSNMSGLTSLVDNYGGAYTFTNYLELSAGTYLTNPSVSTASTSGLTFEQAVDLALTDAQNAVTSQNFAPGSYNFGSWSLVTATPDDVVQDIGRPAQEFLSPNAIPDQPPVPEPGPLVLLATVPVLAMWVQRRQV
jgi:hypothetical protein